MPLCQYSLKLLNNSDAAEDVVQECFAYLWENWQRLENIDSHQHYLFRSVKNRSINYLKRKFNQSKEQLPNELSENIHDWQPSAQEILEVKDLEFILEKALQELPERCRIIFVLKRFENKTTKEIAASLGISIKTVENQMTIAIGRLRAYVLKHWGNSGLLLLNFFLKTSKKAHFV